MDVKAVLLIHKNAIDVIICSYLYLSAWFSFFLAVEHALTSILLDLLFHS